MPHNASPDDPITVLRLLSELEGISGFLPIFDDDEAVSYIEALKKKYYKKYFHMMKEEKLKEDEAKNNGS